MKKIDICYSIDPKFSTEEVVSAWEDHTKELFFRVEDSRADTHFEKDFYAHVLIDEPKLGPAVHQKPDSGESIVIHYGLKLSLKESQNKLLISKFQEPELPKKAGSELVWRDSSPAIFRCSRDVGCKNPYFLVSVEYCRGTFGFRHAEALAIGQILRDDLKLNGPASEIEKLIEEADGAFQKIDSFEKQKINFHLMKERISSFGPDVLKFFSTNNILSIMNWNKDKEPPVNAVGNKAVSKIPEIYNFNLNQFLAYFWATRLSSQFGFSCERAIQYWQSKRDADPLWEEIRNLCMGGWKGTWPSVVKILSAEPILDKSIKHLLGFIADPNWPGSSEAWDKIYRIGGRSIPVIDSVIKIATECNDEWWVENLQSLRESVSSKS